ncbi:MAG: PfkB family carbohydrate kinase [Cellulomonadaceae bacterium]
MTRRVVHTGQAIVDLVMEIDAVPAPGGDTFARRHTLAAGGGFNVMAAAARDGGKVIYAGAHGTGPFGDRVRGAMAAEGITVLGRPHPEEDTGFCVALVDDAAERTFISTLGAEGHATVADYDAAHVTADDIVYVSGYSLLHLDNRAALLQWLPNLPATTTVVVDPTPVIGEIPEDTLHALIRLADVWSTNSREADVVLARLGTPPREDRAGALAQSLGCAVVLRAGAAGADVALPEAGASVHVPAPRVVAVDTNGAGDAHCGVLCAALTRGDDLVTAVRRANAAAALAVTARGPATSPDAARIDAALAGS